MAIHVTRCPHCRTTFRVRDEHLKVANGAVRCGSCLQVFKAAQHFVSEDELKQDTASSQNQPGAQSPSANLTASSNQSASSSRSPSSAQAAPSAPASGGEKPSVAEDDGLIHDDMDDDALIHDDMDDDELIHDDMDQDDDVPDSISDDPMVDFGIRAPDKLDRPAPRNDLEIDSSIFDLKNASTDGLDLLGADSEHHDFTSKKDPDEAWADALLDDDELDNVSVGSLELSDHGDFGIDQNSSADDEFSHFKSGAEADDFDGFIDDDDNLHLGSDDLDNEATEISVPGGLDNLQEDPLHLSEQQTGSSLPWGWTIAALLMLLVAVSQTFYFKFDQWSRTPQWRPLYAQACNHLDCQLPQIQNLKKMTTQHLVVRSHPQLQQALVVDTLIQNLAEYPQPFPDLELVFSDLNDNIVASRRFLPAEYLSGELSGQQQMPSRAPIHVALEIVDPGPEAVSYAIRLRGNQ